MCGSGTLLVEAALIARGDRLRGSFRKRGFAFQRWRDYDAELFEQIKADHTGERTFAHHIYGSDSSMEAVQIARHNVRAAGLTEEITILHRSMQQCPAPEAPALIVTNPPYGERLRMRDAEELYSMIGGATEAQLCRLYGLDLGLPPRALRPYWPATQCPPQAPQRGSGVRATSLRTLRRQAG